MDTLIIELLFISLLAIGIGAYIIGKKKHIDLLRIAGIRSSWIMAFMIVVYTILKFSKEY